MNILLPDSWLREYLETDATPQQIKNCLSLCGPSVERINQVNNDSVYEIEITSNRIDMASVYGIAREASAILPRFGLKATLKTPREWQKPKDTPGVALDDSPGVEGSDKLPIEVSDPNKICNRIMGIVMDVNPMKNSPDYVKERLEKSGVRSLNNLVDITNYVMLEVGHPCHVFDYDRVKTHTFLIRRAKKNESIKTLDNKNYLLNEEDVIIDDGTGKVIDLPGIMGTENSVVTQSTRRIIFFIESNNPILIRKTSMRYGIRTMAAAINEKHPDPELAKTAMLRGIELYEKIAGAKIVSELTDIYPHKTSPKEINVSTAFINERLGKELENEEIVKILEALSFQVTKRGNNFVITPPSFRQFDVTIPEDIVEEVARIYGYHNLPSRLMTGEIPITDKSKDLEVEEEIKNMFKYWGYTEVYNYSFISGELIKKSALKTADHLKVANPLTEETEYMRISLILSLLETIAKNQPYQDNLQLFELAKVYLPHKNKLPDEISMSTIANQAGYYQLKGIVEALFEQLGITDYSLEEKNNKYWHPRQAVSFVKDNLTLATLGKVHPTFTHNFEIRKDLYLADINVDLLVKYFNPIKKYTPIPLYPPVLEDLTLVLPQKSQVGFIIDEIYKISPLIKTVQILNSFKNNITFRITYQSMTKNLSGEEVRSVRKQILQNLENKFKIKLKQ